MAKERKRTWACYHLIWFDWQWNQIGEPDVHLTAHSMIGAIELWNRKSQMIARDEDLIITPTDHPMHLSIEVSFVED